MLSCVGALLAYPTPTFVSHIHHTNTCVLYPPYQSDRIFTEEEEKQLQTLLSLTAASLNTVIGHISLDGLCVLIVFHVALAGVGGMRVCV